MLAQLTIYKTLPDAQNMLVIVAAEVNGFGVARSVERLAANRLRRYATSR
jgi:hypothetical protein